MGIRDNQTMSSKGGFGVFLYWTFAGIGSSAGLLGVTRAKLCFDICVKKTESLSDKQKTEFLVANGFQRFETYRLFLPKAPRGKVDKEVMH